MQPTHRHPPQRFIQRRIFSNFADLTPRQRMRLVADGELIAPGRPYDEAHVVVPVCGVGAMSRDAMSIEIEDFRFDDQIAQPGFFLGFAQRHPREVVVAIGMTAELQPTIEFAVMREQDAPTGPVDEPGRSRQVAGRAVALEAIDVGQRE